MGQAISHQCKNGMNTCEKAAIYLGRILCIELHNHRAQAELNFYLQAGCISAQLLQQDSCATNETPACGAGDCRFILDVRETGPSPEAHAPDGQLPDDDYI